MIEHNNRKSVFTFLNMNEPYVNNGETDFIELTEWRNKAGFDLTLFKYGRQNITIEINYDEFEIIKKLVEHLKDENRTE